MSILSGRRPYIRSGVLPPSEAISGNDFFFFSKNWLMIVHFEKKKIRDHFANFQVDKAKRKKKECA